MSETTRSVPVNKLPPMSIVAAVTSSTVLRPEAGESSRMPLKKRPVQTPPNIVDEPSVKKQKTKLERQVASCWMYSGYMDPQSRAQGHWTSIIGELPPSSGPYRYGERFPDTPLKPKAPESSFLSGMTGSYLSAFQSTPKDPAIIAKRSSGVVANWSNGNGNGGGVASLEMPGVMTDENEEEMESLALAAKLMGGNMERQSSNAITPSPHPSMADGADKPRNQKHPAVPKIVKFAPSFGPGHSTASGAVIRPFRRHSMESMKPPRAATAPQPVPPRRNSVASPHTTSSHTRPVRRRNSVVYRVGNLTPSVGALVGPPPNTFYGDTVMPAASLEATFDNSGMTKGGPKTSPAILDKVSPLVSGKKKSKTAPGTTSTEKDPPQGSTARSFLQF